MNQIKVIKELKVYHIDQLTPLEMSNKAKDYDDTIINRDEGKVYFFKYTYTSVIK